MDWKSKLPPREGPPNTDFPKDVAAMANSGGGVIVYGVQESQKKAIERVDVGEFDEAYERSLRSAAVTAISPPVFGLSVHRLDEADKRAVVVEVPASIDGPHLIYKKEYFGAPVRNDADTVWMKERQIEAMYRMRFDERRHAAEVMNNLYAEAAASRDSGKRAWFIAVAHPRFPRIGSQLTRDDASYLLKEAEKFGPSCTKNYGIHPVKNVDLNKLRPGLRRWWAFTTATDDSLVRSEAWMGIHQDGSVTVAATVGGHRKNAHEYLDGWQVRSDSVECAVADFMALVRAMMKKSGSNEFDIRVGIDWRGEQPLEILGIVDNKELHEKATIPLNTYTPIELTVNTAESDVKFKRHVYDLAKDCVNQGGVLDLRWICPPKDED